MGRKRTNIINNIIVYAILIAVLIIVVFPLLYIMLSSFKTNMEIMAEPDRIFPKVWTLDNYREAWNSDVMNVGRMFFNSMWYTVSTVVITLVVSAVSGYVFARGEFKLKKVIFAIFSSLMFVSLGSITIYPQFEVLGLFGLNKSLVGLVVLNCFGIPIVNMYLVRSFVNSLPKELDEAAKLDGCTFTGIFFRVILPLLKPIMATIAVLTFNGSWNSYVMPAMFTLTNPEQQTLIVGIMALKNSGMGASQWNLMLAGTVIALVPVLVMFAVANKYFVSGLADGAVKG
ncbi:MAG TPA: carbohydrate ABC transporter permease [Candidatus Ornithomonoglobus intestinigallinarum]|uniref:Carbohydrate ABC transporter permease n=1 Tax=Candidatus Ornithomonoglobus intestinigallinarum TaxID=2840894 RepID=A0A9D1H2G2_9FIRM|nr:carbohydrate ABC transporter permease [Candidatus Ornithomonoglobus intestinigallinarum]